MVTCGKVWNCNDITWVLHGLVVFYVGLVTDRQHLSREAALLLVFGVRCHILTVVSWKALVFGRGEIIVDWVVSFVAVFVKMRLPWNRFQVFGLSVVFVHVLKGSSFASIRVFDPTIATQLLRITACRTWQRARRKHILRQIILLRDSATVLIRIERYLIWLIPVHE